MAEHVPNTNSATEVRQAFERLFFKTAIIIEGAAGSVLVSAGIGLDPVWTTSLTALTLLTVDNITINAATITSDTGAISFGDENVTTTGTVSGVNVTSGESPGHTHNNTYFTESEHIATSAGAADAGKPIKLNASGLIDPTMYVPGISDHGGLAGLLDDDHTQYLLANGTRTLIDNMAVTALKTIDGRDLSVDGSKLDGIEAGADVTDATNVAAAGAAMSGGAFHDGFSDFVAAEHLSLPNTIAAVLTDHNLAAHTALGLFDSSGDVDHGSVGGLGDDDHAQYHNDARGDARYFTEAEHIATSAGVADAGKPIKLDASGLIDSTMIPPGAGSADHGLLTGLGDDDHTQYFRTDGTRTMTGQINADTFGLTTTGGINSGAIVSSKTWTSYAAADAYGVSVSSIVNTGWATGWNYGFFSQGYCNGNAGDASMQVMGGIGRGYYQSSGTLGWLIGLKGDCYVWNAAASGTIQETASFYAQYIAYGGGATATLTTTYGIYIEDRSVGSTRWAVYHTGTDSSRIGGRLGIGGDPSNGMLDITLSEAGTAARQDCINTTYTNTGTNSYNSIGRGVQGAYVNITCGIATNYNGIYIIPQTNNAATSNIGTLCAIQAYSGYGYHASATVGTAIGLYLRGWGNQAPGAFTEHYGIKIDAISGANTNYAILTTSGLVVFNESGADSDTRIEGDTVANLFFCDAGNDKVGIGTATPAGKFDVNFTLAGTAAEQDLITGGFTQTGTNSYNTNGLGTQGLYINVLSHGATNVNGIYIKHGWDNNATIGTLCGIQLWTGYGEDGAGCTVTTSIGIWIKGAGNLNPATWTNHYGLKIDAIYGAATLNYAIHTTRGNIVFNESGNGDSDVRMESDLDANCFFLDASANNIGIGTNAPTTRLDILSASGYSGLRLRTAKTPSSAAAAGAVGEICWDANYIYVCTATNTWKRALIATWV